MRIATSCKTYDTPIRNRSIRISNSTYTRVEIEVLFFRGAMIAYLNQQQQIQGTQSFYVAPGRNAMQGSEIPDMVLYIFTSP
jgi:hypothetical protein